MFIQSRKRKLLINRFFFVVFSITAAFSLTACGNKNQDLKEYKEKMEGFASHIEQLTETLNSLEENTEDGKNTLLSTIDELNNTFYEMSEWDVPEEFSSVDSLADEAYQNFTQAAELYHQAFEKPEESNESHLKAAHEYTARAFKRIDYIGTLLRGELPSDDDVTIISNETHDNESATS